MSPIPRINTTIGSDMMNNLWNSTNSVNLTNIDTSSTLSNSLLEYNQTIIKLLQIICNKSSPFYNSLEYNSTDYNIDIIKDGSGFIEDFYDEYDKLIYPLSNCSNFFNITNNTKPNDNIDEIKTTGLLELCIGFGVFFLIIGICVCRKNIYKSICNFMNCWCSCIGNICSSFYWCVKNIIYSIKITILISRSKIFDNNIQKTSLNILRKNNNKIYSNECIICMEPFKGTIRVLPCEHAFHKDCLKPWIKTALIEKRNAECPICRQKIYSDIAFQKKINILEGNLERPNRQRSVSVVYYSSSTDYSDYYDEY